MITKYTCYKKIPKDVTIKREKNNINKYFCYKNYVSLVKVCENLRKNDDESVYEALDIFSKKHYDYRDTLYYNLQTIDVSTNYDKKITGSYVLMKNYNLLTYSNSDSVYHEVLHVSSTSYDEKNDILYSGFGYYNFKSNENFGEGITEGFVELMCDKDLHNDNFISSYDDEENRFKIAYCYVKAIAKQLEIIFGYKLLEKYFFSGNPNLLISELCKYARKEEVIKFFYNCDAAAIADSYNNLVLIKKTLSAQNFLYDIVKKYFPEKEDFFSFEMLERNKKYKGLVYDTKRMSEEISEHLSKRGIK